MLLISDNKGEPFTWSLKYQSANRFYISLNSSNPSHLYLADKRKILKSTDFGDTFNILLETEKNIMGIYKKPSSDKLYAVTKYQMLEIINDNITVIKELPMPAEIFNYYPLHVGNKWFYEVSRVEVNTPFPEGDTVQFVREIIGKEIKSNGKEYYIINDFDYYNFTNIIFHERIDSLTGLVYRYNTDFPNDEIVIDNLFIEKNDIYDSYRYYEPRNFSYIADSEFRKFNINKNKRILNTVQEDINYSLTEGIGIDTLHISFLDYYNVYLRLKGFYINGKAAGDTITNIKEENFIPLQFSLSQNYPNPFNPSTLIEYVIASDKGAKQSVTLKVYDVLGNEVATLVNENQSAGKYSISFNAANLSSGIYYYQLKAGDFIQTKKMVLLK